MMSHVVVGDGNGGGSMDGINEAIMAVRQGAMVHPYMPPSKDGNSITVRYGPPTRMVRGVPYISIPSLLTVVDVNAMDDDVSGIMYGNAWPTGNVNTGTSTIDGLEGVHD